MQERAMNVTDKIDLLERNEQPVKKASAWTGLDTKTRLLIAAMFANKEQEVDPDAFKDLADWIKEQTSAWSYLRTNIRFSVAANLMLYTADPKKAFDSMMQMYDQLIDSGFRRHNVTYLAALAVTTQEPELSNEERVRLADRAIALYKAIRNDRMFSTNEYDYPLVVLLAAGREEPVEAIAREVNDTYERLRKGHWKRGNDLQGLTHILALDTEKSVDEHVQRANDLFEAWERELRRVKPAFYSEIGVLTVRSAITQDITIVRDLEERINTLPAFRWNKELGTMIAAQFTASSDLEESPVSEHMMTTLAILQQAEMAMMMATVGAVTVATTSGN
ncbi:DUF4003 family protein [Alteribacter keqinensis]|uniref:DUF4003 family protein n=1 Tax=Alteribacter keqinensis TaxID=2483800 RepID=A0A3M7TPG0_9BACI|nr:DUF4003 family protein [Alteribacter keqinensis]RNA66907.1 DUF4003 family protein [Alteribacter keqinensis]